MTTTATRPARPAQDHDRQGRGPWGLVARATAVRAAGWLVLAMPVVMFLAEDGLGRFANPGEAVNALGIIAGLVATSALLLMLLLAARIPAVDRTLGQPLATSLHAQLGNAVVLGLLGHAVAVIAGYAIMDGLSIVEEFC